MLQPVLVHNTDFNQFVAFKDLVPGDARNSKFLTLFPELLSRSSKFAHMKITLKVRTTTKTTLEQVRIDIKACYASFVTSTSEERYPSKSPYRLQEMAACTRKSPWCLPRTCRRERSYFSSTS